nr:pentatricopeptide repeat-containing protein At1g62910-like [Ipomoea batatas]
MSFSTSATETLESESTELVYSELQHKMQGYAASGCIKKAFEVLYAMRCVSGKPTVHDYNSLLYFHMKSKVVVIDELGEIYLGMKRFGPSPNAITFNTMLNGMVSLGRLRDGILIAKEMFESGFLPSFTALSKLLKKSFILGSLEDTLSLFVFMLRLGYVPTEPSLRKLILALCKVGRVPEAYQVLSVLISKDCFQDQLLRDMHQQRLGPYIFMCGLIYRFCKEGKLTSDLQLSTEIRVLKKILSSNRILPQVAFQLDVLQVPILLWMVKVKEQLVHPLDGVRVVDYQMQDLFSARPHRLQNGSGSSVGEPTPFLGHDYRS